MECEPYKNLELFLFKVKVLVVGAIKIWFLVRFQYSNVDSTLLDLARLSCDNKKCIFHNAES